MTDLKKAVKRRTALTIRDGSKRRRLVVTLMPGDILGLRPEGTRRNEYVDLHACYDLAVRHRVSAEKREKTKRGHYLRAL